MKDNDAQLRLLAEVDKRALKPETKRPVRPWEWLMLLAPPLVASPLAAASFLVAFTGVPFGIVFFLLTPLACAIYAFTVCKRLARSSTALLVLLFGIELVLIVFAFLLSLPPWE